jgi:hypothetical protein
VDIQGAFLKISEVSEGVVNHPDLGAIESDRGHPADIRYRLSLPELLGAVLFGMDLGSLRGVMTRVLLMPMRSLGVMSSLFVVACIMMGGRLTVVPGGGFMVLCGLTMMVSGFFGHCVLSLQVASVKRMLRAHGRPRLRCHRLNAATSPSCDGIVKRSLTMRLTSI